MPVEHGQPGVDRPRHVLARRQNQLSDVTQQPPGTDPVVTSALALALSLRSFAAIAVSRTRQGSIPIARGSSQRPRRVDL